VHGIPIARPEGAAAGRSTAPSRNFVQPPIITCGISEYTRRGKRIYGLFTSAGGNTFDALCL
jgi:hypothetical protein